MPADRHDLPDDVETLKRLVIGRDELIAKLMAEIARWKRWRFGNSAERVDATLVQLQLLLDDLQTPMAQAVCDQEGFAFEESTQAPPRKPAPQTAPCAARLAGPPAAGNHCSRAGALQLSRPRRRDTQTGRRHLGNARFHTGLVQGAAPRAAEVLLQPVCSGDSAAGAVASDRSGTADIQLARAGDHCQIRRSLSVIPAAGDLPALRVDLDRATLTDWVASASRLLEPLVEALGRYVRSAQKLHAHTPVPVLDPGRGKSKTGRLWTYVRDDRPAASKTHRRCGTAIPLTGKVSTHELKAMRLTKAAELVEAKAHEALTYFAFPSNHWRQIKTNNPLERIIREIRRRTRVVGAFPDGHSALMLVAARLRHIASTK